MLCNELLHQGSQSKENAAVRGQNVTGIQQPAAQANIS